MKLRPVPSYLASMMRILLFAGLLFYSSAAVAQDSLWVITEAWFQGEDSLMGTRFELTPEWTGHNAVIDRAEDQTSSIVLINTDTVDHVFSTNAPEAESIMLEAGASTNVALPAMPQGSFRYFLSDERGKVLGGSGMIRTGWTDETLFYWNLSDWDPIRTLDAAAGMPIDFDAPYVPRFFTVNEESYPSTSDDPNALVAVSLGDTSFIAIANHGFMDHVLHFHGFHIIMVSSTGYPERVGWNKDTVPIRRGESLTVRLIAYQEGMYPVHNHNLIAVTNAGFYPGGMITTIHVMP